MINNNFSWLEINAQAFHDNIKQLYTLSAPAQLALVIKSNAYGHGLKEIVQLSDQNPFISWLCTASLSEALYAKKYSANSQKSLLVLSYLDENIEEAIINKIHCVVYNSEIALQINTIAQRLGKKAYVHVKIDTGMSRLGILYYQAYDFIKYIKNLSNIILYGIFTHLADPLNQDQYFSYLQLNRFKNIVLMLQKNNIDITCIHALSSSGLDYVYTGNYSLTRIGSLAYGLWKTEEHKANVTKKHPRFSIQPILTWKTRIIDIKIIPKGSKIGYNCTYSATRDTTIAILPIGYADGYNRLLSNKCFVLIHNQPAPVIGIISMNLTVVDITDINFININDEVILLSNTSTPNSFTHSNYEQTITNEVITRLPNTIKRVVIDAIKTIEYNPNLVSTLQSEL